MACKPVSLTQALQLVEDGTLTLLDRPDWTEDPADIYAANAGCMNAAMRVAASINDDWTWRVGYDNQAVLTNRQDQGYTISAISLTPAHALLIATLQAMSRGIVARDRRAGECT